MLKNLFASDKWVPISGTYFHSITKSLDFISPITFAFRAGLYFRNISGIGDFYQYDFMNCFLHSGM